MYDMHKANKMIVDVLNLIERDQVVAYLEAKSWLVEDYPDGTIQLYHLKRPDRSARITLPLDFSHNLSTLQGCLERMAIAEETSFVGIICSILGIEQLVLKPPL